MKLLFDSNVWVAAFGTRGLCERLVAHTIKLDDLAVVRLMICPAIRQEVIRILEAKFRLSAEELARATVVMDGVDNTPDGRWQPVGVFPDPDDVPIIGAALAAGADLFVTGDQALLELDRIEGLPIVTPRTAFLKLRGLE